MATNTIVEKNRRAGGRDDRHYSQTTAILKAMAHPVRLKLLELIAKAPLCASQANQTIPVSQPNLSQHLKALRDAGIVDCRREGAKRCYFIQQPALVKSILRSLNAI